MSQPINELSDAALDALIERERTRPVAPLTTWAALSAQLRDEGLLRESSQHKEPASPRATAPYGRWTRRAGQVAAGAALAALGFIAGRGTLASASEGNSPTTTVATEIA